jgi:hypothetical protein
MKTRIRFFPLVFPLLPFTPLTPLTFLSCSYSTRVRPRHHDDRVYPLIRVALRAPEKAQTVSEFFPLVSLRTGEMHVPADRQEITE